MATISEYLEGLATENTRRIYRGAVISFLQFAGNDLHDRKDLAYWDRMAAAYIQKQVNGGAFTDLQRFINARITKGNAPKSNRCVKAAIVGWLEDSGLELPRKVQKQLKSKCKGGAQTIDRIPTRDELRAILTHSKQPMHALLLTLFSGGMRISEALALKWEDVDLDADPVRVKVTSEKTQSRYTAYISREARESLLQWKKYYPDYLTVREKKIAISLRATSKPNGRIFPMSDCQVRRTFYTLIKKSGCAARDSSTNRYEVHIHSARKWFSTMVGKTGNEGMMQRLTNHAGYLQGSYDRTPPEEVARFYKENEQLFWIYTPVNVNTPEMQERMAEQDARIKAQDEEIRRLKESAKFEDLVLKITEIRAELDRIQQKK